VAKRAVGNGLRQGPFTPGLYACFDEVAHGFLV
jgi:hypothetical protein